MSMKNSIDTIGNRIRDLQASSAVPQPTAPPRGPKIDAHVWNKILKFFQILLGCSSEENRYGGEMCQFLPAGNFEF
jgi:hypothetical protein